MMEDGLDGGGKLYLIDEMPRLYDYPTFILSGITCASILLLFKYYEYEIVSFIAC